MLRLTPGCKARSFIYGCCLALSMPAVCAMPSSFAEEAPLASHSLDEIRIEALKSHTAIKSLKIIYIAQDKVVREIPEIPVVPRHNRLTTVFSGERRSFFTEPLDTAKQQLPQLLVFDSDATLTCDVRDGRITNIFINSGKHSYADRDDPYLNEALDTPLSDKTRSTMLVGFYYPYCIAARNASNEPSALKYELLPRQEKVDGEWCHVVELPGLDKIWVDTKIGCAWRRRDRYYDRKSRYLLTRKNNSEFRNLGDNIWVPWRYFRESFTPPANKALKNALFHQLFFEVQSAEVNSADDADFRVSVPAGTTIANMDTGGSVRIPRPIDDSVKGLAEVSQSQLRTGWWLARWLSLVVLAICGILIGVFWSHRRSRRT